MAGSGGEETNGDTIPNTKNETVRPWSAVAKMNNSKRNQTNTLEVRLENDERKGFTLNNEEIENLLNRLNILSNQFTSVQKKCRLHHSVQWS